MRGPSEQLAAKKPKAPKVRAQMIRFAFGEVQEPKTVTSTVPLQFAGALGKHEACLTGAERQIANVV